MLSRVSRTRTLVGLAFALALALGLALPATASAVSPPTAPAVPAVAPNPAPAIPAVAPNPAPAIEDSLPFEAAVFLGCDKLPAGPRAVRLGLGSHGSAVAVRDVIGLLTSLSCSPVQPSAGVALETKVQMTSPPALVSAREAFSIMDAALTSAGLVLQAEKSGPAQFQLFIRPRAAGGSLVDQRP
jgi:hypothetical protein